MKRKFIIAALVSLGLLAAIPLAWSEMFPSGTWRYKIIVTVETPEGIQTGSSVREVTISTPPINLPEATASKKVKGEAVVIDLGKRGVVFGLIGDGYSEVFNAFPRVGTTTPEGIKYYSSLKPGLSAQLPRQNWPVFVMFKDINNPLSVDLVLGASFDAKTQKMVPIDNIKKLFGEGVLIRDIVIEITEDPVTLHVEKWLAWLQKVKVGSLDGKLTGGGPTLSNILHYGNFKRSK